uniref:Choline transporter-like protein n=1 Tax=Macrostomum lignano TaxID=282301 RepID=A0A1I8F6P8_9PLAT
MGKGRCCKDDEAEYNKVRDHDKDFKGPIENRSCTDIVCCLLFVACVILLLLIATVVQLGCPTPQVCVASCPTRMWAWLPAHLAETGGDLNGPVKTTIAAEREKMVCLGGRNAMEPEYQSLSIRDLVQNHLCAPYTCRPMLGRCLPKLLKGVGGRVVSSMTTLPNNVTSANNRSIGADTVRRGTNTMARFIKVYSYLQALFEDVVQSWQWIVGGCLLAVAVSLLWVLLLRYLAKPIVILSIVLFVLLFAAATAFTVYKYIILRGQSDSLEKNTKLTFDFGYYLHLSRTWLFLAIVSGSLFIIVLFLLIWLRRRICIAIALISHTSHCLGHMMSCLVFPLLPFVLQFGVLVFFIITAIHISSLGDPVMRQIDNETFLADLNFTSLSTEEAKQKINDLLTHLIPCNPNSTNVAGSMCRFLKYGDDALEEVKREEHELLEIRSEPLRNYLMKHVMPNLTKGLMECAKVRPDDAIDYLAEYLFRNNPQVD